MEKSDKPKRPAVISPRRNLDPWTAATTYPLKTNSWNPGPLQVVVALGLAAFAVLSAPEGRAQTPNPSPATTQQPSAKTLHDWHKGMARVPLPKKGCFTSSYPSTEWQEVPCTTAPAHPYPPARGPRPDTVGNGNDVSAQVTGHISEAIGSFDSVTGVTSVSSPGGVSGFSLQLNANFFTTPTCNGAANPSICLGWQQFVYSNTGIAFVQFWLIHFNATCPGGWNTFTPQGTTEIDCFMNGAAVNVPVQTVANLANLSLTGQANAGGLDTIIMATGSNLYSVQNDDGVVNLAQGWQAAEYNIIGDCCGSQATFNSGSTIVVRTSVDYGSPNAPSCSSQGFTGETNNLSFVQASAAPPKESLPAVVFTESNIGGTTSPCASATGVSASSKLVDTHDFNGNGKSDIAWRDTSGDAAIWLMNGAQPIQSAGLATVPTAWTIVGQRDFNGDGKADLLWRNTTTGDVAIWLMDGAQVTQSAGVATVPPAWTIVGTGDFNGDGKADLLWQNTTTGDVAIWLMNGAQVTQSAGVATVPTAWTVAGTGDFNGDGKADLLWQNTTTGDVAIWLMNGAQVTQFAGVATVPTAWTIVGTGDFNGDGKSDILWRDTSGDVAIWLMNGAQVIQSSGVATVPTTWTIVETGDFDGDGKSDILWHDTSGNVAIWFMNGTQVTQFAGVATVPTVWSIQGANAD
jgi:FG-GAP-like repeat